VYLCLCKGITESEVEQVGRQGILGAAELIEVLGLDDELCCGNCALEIHAFQAVAQAAWAPPLPTVAHSHQPPLGYHQLR
jgi:bacterioferritin-associated ferredoxin